MNVFTRDLRMDFYIVSVISLAVFISLIQTSVVILFCVAAESTLSWIDLEKVGS